VVGGALLVRPNGLVRSCGRGPWARERMSRGMTRATTGERGLYCKRVGDERALESPYNERHRRPQEEKEDVFINSKIGGRGGEKRVHLSSYTKASNF